MELEKDYLKITKKMFHIVFNNLQKRVFYSVNDNIFELKTDMQLNLLYLS